MTPGPRARLGHARWAAGGGTRGGGAPGLTKSGREQKAALSRRLRRALERLYIERASERRPEPGSLVLAGLDYREFQEDVWPMILARTIPAKLLPFVEGARAEAQHVIEAALFAQLGIERVARDVPSLSEYLAQKDAEQRAARETRAGAAIDATPEPETSRRSVIALGARNRDRRRASPAGRLSARRTRACASSRSGCE